MNDTERLDWMCAEYGFKREAIDAVIADPSLRRPCHSSDTSPEPYGWYSPSEQSLFENTRGEAWKAKDRIRDGYTMIPLYSNPPPEMSVWIEFRAEQPPPGHSYLVFGGIGQGQTQGACEVLFYHPKQSSNGWPVGYQSYNEPTHWMLLPDPPPLKDSD